MSPPEPPIGCVLIEETGHSWRRADDGDWYCSCGDPVAWDWVDVVEDIGGPLTVFELRSPPGP